MKYHIAKWVLISTCEGFKNKSELLHYCRIDEAYILCRLAVALLSKGRSTYIFSI